MEKIIKAIKKAQHIVILGHISEDADSVGSALAMRAVLENMGKDAVAYLSAPPEKRLAFLAEDMPVFESDDTEYDLCICVDCGDLGRLGKRQAVFDSAKTTVSIDHHITNTNFAQINLVVPDACATGEILYDLFSKMCGKIDKKTASYLFAAIASDTGSFKYSNVTPKTFMTAAKLIEYGIDNAYISRKLFDTEEESVMRFKGYLMGNVRTEYNGQVSVVAVRSGEFEKFGIEEKDCSDIVNIARQVSTAKIAVSLRQTNGKIKISFRSDGDYDVGAVAGKFGGGGHKAASGATVEDSDFDKVYNDVIKRCGELLNDRV